MEIGKFPEMSRNNDRKSEMPLPELEAWELALVEVFCRAVAMLGLHKSVGMVCGALYCSKEPLATTDLQQKLKLSRGACVEATQLLTRFGAVRLVVKIGERKDFFEAETDLKKFATSTLQEVLLPGIDKVSQRLEHAEKLSRGKTAKAKIAQLKRAKDAVSALAPMVENFLKD